MAEPESAVSDRVLSATLLGDVDEEVRLAISGVLVEDEAPSGAILLRQGEPNDHLSFLIAGKAILERAWPEGRTETLATIEAPSVFGTTSFFVPTPPPVTVRAITPVKLLTLSHPAHERLRAENPRAAEALALAVVKTLTDRFNIIDALFTEFIANHRHDTKKVDEWAGFRARFFQEP